MSGFRFAEFVLCPRRQRRIAGPRINVRTETASAFASAILENARPGNAKTRAVASHYHPERCTGSFVSGQKRFAAVSFGACEFCSLLRNFERRFVRYFLVGRKHLRSIDDRQKPGCEGTYL